MYAIKSNDVELSKRLIHNLTERGLLKDEHITPENLTYKIYLEGLDTLVSPLCNEIHYPQYEEIYADEYLEKFAVKNKKEQFITCECQTEIIKLERWGDEKEVYFTVFQYLSDRYSFWERLKIMFNGKVRTCDLVLSEESFNKIKEF